MIITIDGPVASGKSSVAKVLARELNIYYLYTGLLYRAVAFVFLKKLKDKQKYKDEVITDEIFELNVKSLESKDLEFIKAICYDYGKNEAESRPYIFYQEKDITQDLYDISLEQFASIISANKFVRHALLDLQRDIAKRYDIVADGRDCGSVVFPDADYKFYLTASSDVRAQRLMLDESRGKIERNLEKVKAELEQRDKRDSEREVAPLTIPENAIVIDNSKLTLELTIDKFLQSLSR